jgi:hypothetical protein
MRNINIKPKTAPKSENMYRCGMKNNWRNEKRFPESSSINMNFSLSQSPNI